MLRYYDGGIEVLLWYEYVLIAAIFATTLTLTVVIAFLASRVRVQKWIGGAIGNFMTNLAREAEKEGAKGGGASGGGSLKIAGFEITPGLIQSIAQLAQLAQQLGFLKGGTSGGGGPSGL